MIQINNLNLLVSYLVSYYINPQRGTICCFNLINPYQVTIQKKIIKKESKSINNVSNKEIGKKKNELQETAEVANKEEQQAICTKETEVLEGVQNLFNIAEAEVANKEEQQAIYKKEAEVLEGYKIYLI